MNLKTKLNQLEQKRNGNIIERFKAMSEEEIAELCRRYEERDPVNSALCKNWLTTLTDAELDTICDNRPGAKAIWRKFDEYKKQG